VLPNWPDVLLSGSEKSGQRELEMRSPSKARKGLLSPGRLARKSIDIMYMARDFLGMVTHTDYYHPRARLGSYFVDGRSYYVDFRKKVEWKGKYVEGVPALFIPSSKRYILFPGMVLQYGIGAVDSFFNTGDKRYLSFVADVYAWIVTSVTPNYSFDNYSAEMNSGAEFFSNNSGMTQGLALSFLSRVVTCDLVKGVSEEAVTLMRSMYANMLQSLENGGTAIYEGEDLYFCEYCQKDREVILNGWVFAAFGLHDCEKMFEPAVATSAFQKTLRSLGKRAGDYMMPGSNWSYYDNKGRTASPTYQLLHICLMDALYRLSSVETFGELRKRLQKGNNCTNIGKYTLVKVMDKIRDSDVYSR